MDWITLITVLAGIAGILGLLYIIFIGQQPFIEWWRQRRQRQLPKVSVLLPPKEVTESPQAVFPKVVETREALESRVYHNALLRGYIQSQEDMDAREFLSPILEVDDLIAPTVRLPSSSPFIDCICSAVTREGRTTILLPSGESTPDVEGVGRTAVLLRLLRLAIPYGRLFGLNLDEIRSLSRIPIYVQSNPWCRLLAADIVYLGASGGRLSIVPTKGEAVSFAWDLARHIYRTTELEYKTGDHRKEPGRQKLLEIFHRIPFSPLKNTFGKLEALYLVDEIIILRRKIEAWPSPPVRRELVGQERFKLLRESLLVPLRHGAVFWRRDPRNFTNCVDAIMQALDKSKICPISEITLSYRDTVIPNHVFDTVAELIRRGEQLKAPKIWGGVNVGIGIGFHNDILIRSLYDVDEIRLLVTSGEKLFKDACFWKALSQVSGEMRLKILMLDPDSPSVYVREKRAYSEKKRGFLAEEIRENIETIKRMSDYFDRIGKPVHIQCSVYSESPSFRMTFIGRHRLLVTSYVEGKRTGDTTVFYDISSQQKGTLFDGFDREYRRIESTARSVF